MYICVCVSVSLYVCMHACMYVSRVFLNNLVPRGKHLDKILSDLIKSRRKVLSMYVCVYVYIYTHIHMYVYVCVCMSVSHVRSPRLHNLVQQSERLDNIQSRRKVQSTYICIHAYMCIYVSISCVLTSTQQSGTAA
jgi:hypothetical protein